MDENADFLPGFTPPPEVPNESEAHQRWLRELGRDTERLAYMMRKPTDVRPFVHEVRFDLIPAKRSDPVLVAKGFGTEGAVVAFHSAAGFLQMLRGFGDQLASGKVKWYEDMYPPGGYADKLARYMGGDYYRG